MSCKLKFYEIDDFYIDYLRQFDDTVPKTKIENRKENRKYTGILFNIDNMDYLAPLSSFKEKHNKIKEKIDFIKIGNYAVVNLNNMIPVKKNVIHPVNFNNIKDVKYRHLLQNEYKIIKDKSKKIFNNADILYRKVTLYNEPIAKRCCNFKLLEEKCLGYNFEKQFIFMLHEHEQWIDTNGLKGKKLILENANLSGMRISNYNLMNSSLKNSDLSNCIIHADLQSANLNGIKINEKTKWIGSNLTNAKIDKDTFSIIKKQINSNLEKHNYGLNCLKTTLKEAAITKE